MKLIKSEAYSVVWVEFFLTLVIFLISQNSFASSDNIDADSIQKSKVPARKINIPMQQHLDVLGLQVRNALMNGSVTPRDCPKPSAAMVVVILGQSNAGNFGNEKYVVQAKNIFNYFNGFCYAAKDPLLGSMGEGGSIWGRFADLLLKENVYDNIILVPLGYTGAKIKRWEKGFDLNSNLIYNLRSLKSFGYEVTHLLWQQGEADANFKTSSLDYQKSFISLLNSIRGVKVNAPIFVAISTYCDPKNGKKDGLVIQGAQKKLAKEIMGVFPGPDTDQFSGEMDRHDRCHLSGVGQQKAARAWVETIKKYSVSN